MIELFTNWKWVAEHHSRLLKHHIAERDRYKAMLFDAWRALAQQQKGMRRMSRKIKRLQAQLRAAQGQDRRVRCRSTGSS